MINSAKNLTLKNTNSALPNMSETITSWFLDVIFYTVTKQKQGADWIELPDKELKTKGVVQPTKDEDLKIYPEGMRAWVWLTVHCLPNLNLEVNQYIYYDDKKYKVMAKKDYSKYGYIRYIIVETFQSEELNSPDENA